MSAADLPLEDALSAFANGVIGTCVSPQVDQLIRQAALLYHEPQQALTLLEQARAAEPRHPAPLIALYRFHFYGHRLVQAAAAGEDALAIARTALGPDFGDAPPSDEDVRYHAAVRFYLFALKGLAYLNLRLGAIDEVRRFLKELRRLDPNDHVGGGLLSHILQRHEGDGSPAAALNYPVRGWYADTP